MQQKNKLLYKLHSQTKAYQAKIEVANKTITTALSQVRHPYVAWSVGKDSSVLLDLVLRQNPKISVRFLYWRNESDLIDNYQEVIKWWQDRNINLEVIQMSRVSLDEKVKSRWETVDYDSYFIGFRADESKGRAATLRYNGMIYKKLDGMTRIAPLAWWNDTDVGAYLESRGIPLLASYEGDVTNRTSSRVPRDDYGIRSRMLMRLKQRDPAAFNALAVHFPEVKEYV